VFQHSSEAVHIDHGHTLLRAETGGPAGNFLSHVRTRKRDKTLQQSLDASSKSPATKKWIVAYLEGFNAAHQERASIDELKKESEAAEEVEGDHVFRILSGYASIPNILAQSSSAIWKNHVVERVNWKPQNVQVLGHSTLDGRRFEISCARLVV